MVRSRRRYFLPLAVLGFLVVVCVGWFMMMSPSSHPGPQNIEAPAEMQKLSQEFASDVQTHISQIRTVMLDLSRNLTGLTPDDPRTVGLIRSYYNQYPDATGFAWVDANGSVCREPVYSLPTILNSPEIAAINESSFAGHDILMIGPLASRTYGMVLCFVVPVYAEDGTYNGFVCMSHVAVLLLNVTPDTPYFKDTFYGMWVINDDGTYLYHPDSGLIGQNIYTDPLFLNAPSILPGIKMIAASPEGALNYTGYEPSFTTVVEKTGVWTTVSFGGQDVRLVLDSYFYEPPETVLPKKINLSEMRHLAESIVVYASAHGKEQTLAAINDPTGPFTVPGYGIAAFDMDGTMLAKPSEPYGVGMDRSNFRDTYGMLSVESMINRCLQGGGYVHSYLTYPYTDHLARLRLAYVLPVGNNDWFISVGGSVQDHLVSYNLSKRTDVVRTVHEAEKYVADFGKEAALAKMMDPADPLAREDTYLFALDYNGTLLADDVSPADVGKDVFYYTDSYGNSPIRELTIVARAGGGYFYIQSEDPVTRQYLLSLGYVEPVDDTWCIASTIKVDTYEPLAETSGVHRVG